MTYVARVPSAPPVDPDRPSAFAGPTRPEAASVEAHANGLLAALAAAGLALGDRERLQREIERAALVAGLWEVRP